FYLVVAEGREGSHVRYAERAQGDQVRDEQNKANQHADGAEQRGQKQDRKAQKAEDVGGAEVGRRERSDGGQAHDDDHDRADHFGRHGGLADDENSDDGNRVAESFRQPQPGLAQDLEGSFHEKGFSRRREGHPLPAQGDAEQQDRRNRFVVETDQSHVDRGQE